MRIVWTGGITNNLTGSQTYHNRQISKLDH